jgi:pyruvate dehydrogenase E2 component (dihydrolipoamide acetyltransferase)
MPQMGFDMKEGKIVRWLKKEGEPVQRGESIAEIETDKATVELEAFGTGVLRKVIVPEGETRPVGDLLAFIGSPDEPLPEIPQQAPASGAATAPTAKAAPSAARAAPARAEAPVALAAPPGEIKVSPVARRLAEEHGVDLRQVKGTGPGGRIQKEDVQAYIDGKAKAPAAAPAAPAVAAPAAVPERIPLTRMRQAIARRMTQSKQQIPHFYVTVEVDMTDAMRLRQELNETAGLEARVSVNDLIVKASAKALQKFLPLNSTFTEEGIAPHKGIHVGIAIAMEDGLIAPAILDCDKKPLGEIAKASKDLQERAKGGVLKPEEYTGATFTVSNLGMFDVEEFIAIITPGQSAALAVGGVRPKPVVGKDQQIVVRQMMRATVSADHRVTDGAQVAQFANEIRTLLQNPLRLLL